MQVQSLGRQTDMIFIRFNGEVLDRGSYTVLKSPDNPGHHFGNYLVFDSPPTSESYSTWMELFQKELPACHHRVFAWNPSPAPPLLDPFVAKGFIVEKNILLTANFVHPPRFENQEIVIRPYAESKDWDEALEFQMKNRGPEFEEESHRRYKIQQLKRDQKMNEASRGAHFGAYLNGQLVADLGIYFEKKCGRFQQVVTDEQHRKKGICGTLVYQAAKYAFENWNLDTLVMEADPDYHAARIYESVGFKPFEETLTLYRAKA